MKSTVMLPFIEPVTLSDRWLPEGPREVVVNGRAALAWVNIQTAADAISGSIHLRFWDNGERRTLQQPGRPGFIIPTDRPNVILAGMGKQVGLIDLASNTWEPKTSIDDDNLRTTINDGEVSASGNVVVLGTKDLKFAEPIAKLYLLTVHGFHITELAEGHTCSNGKFFVSTKGETYLFDIDTPRRNIMKYHIDLESREIIGEERAVDLSGIAGFPDGMIDAGDGSAIVAIYNPAMVNEGRVIRVELHSGEIIEEWRVPGSPRVTCPLLIEQDGRVDLIVTTCDEGMPPEIRAQNPQVGALLRGPTGLRSLPPQGLVMLS